MRRQIQTNRYKADERESREREREREREGKEINREYEQKREMEKEAETMDKQLPPLQLGLMYLQRIASGCCS